MLSSNQPDSTLAKIVFGETGISVDRCYQCGKCSAGCPAAGEMDIAPSVIMHLLQTKNSSHDSKALRSYSIWLCLACETCFTRCPMEIDLPKIMDALRQVSVRGKMVHKKAKDIVAFHKSFIEMIRHFGRMWEVGLIADYKFRTRHFWQDVMVAPTMFKKGKLALFPSLHKKPVESLFERKGSKTENLK